MLREQIDLFEQDFLALSKPEFVEAYTKALKTIPSESGARTSNVRDVILNGIKEVVVGDKTHIEGNVTGSAIGRGAKVETGDITVYNQTIDKSENLAQDVKEQLKNARKAIEDTNLSQADRADILDDLGKLTAELQKPRKTHLGLNDF